MMKFFSRVLFLVLISISNSFDVQAAGGPADFEGSSHEQICCVDPTAVDALSTYHQIKEHLSELSWKECYGKDCRSIIQRQSEIGYAQIALETAIRNRNEAAIMLNVRKVLAENFRGLCLLNSVVLEVSGVGTLLMPPRKFLQELRQLGILTNLDTLEALL